MRSNAISHGAGMEPGGAVDTVAVHQSDCRHLKFHSPFDQTFRLRCAFKKAESAGGVQFHISLSHTAPPSPSNSAPHHGRCSHTAHCHPQNVPPDPTVLHSTIPDSTNPHL